MLISRTLNDLKNVMIDSTQRVLDVSGRMTNWTFIACDALTTDATENAQEDIYDRH